MKTTTERLIWTWQSSEKFTFDDWTGWFFGPEGGGGIGIAGVSGMLFENDHINPTITGWGVGIGAGVGFGIAWSKTKYVRAKNWMIPFFLRRIVVPAP